MLGPAAGGRRSRRSGVADWHRHFVTATRRGKVFCSDPCANRCSRSHRIVHSCANIGPDPISSARRHAHSGEDTDAISHADADFDSHRDAFSNSDANLHPYSCSVADPASDAHLHRYSHRDAFTNSGSHLHRYSCSVADPVSDGFTDTITNANCHTSGSAVANAGPCGADV